MCHRQAIVAGEGIVFYGCPYVRYFVRLFVYYQTYGHGILKINELTLMQIGASGLQRKGVKRSTLGVRRSKIDVTRGRS